MHQLKATLAGMGTTLSQLNSVQLSTSLQRQLVLTATQLSEQANAVAGATFSQDQYDFDSKDADPTLTDAQICCLAALGARSSGHSSIVGHLTGTHSGSSSPPAGKARLIPFKALADRALKVSTAAGLLSVKLTPTLETYETLMLLRYALTGVVSRHDGYDEVNKMVLKQRNALLGDPTVGEEVKAKVTCRESVSLLLCDCIQAIQVEAEYCCFTDEDLARDFGWSLEGLSADLGWVKASAAGGVVGVSANEIFDAVGRLSVWVVRSCVDLRRTGWAGDVDFDSVVPTLGSVTNTLFDLGLAFDAFRASLERARIGPRLPDDFAVWQFCLSFVERKLISYNMLVWDVTAVLLENAQVGSVADGHQALVDELQLRAAQSIRFLLTETPTHSVLVTDYFHKLSFIGGFFSALNPGLEAVRLAVECVRQGRSGGRLAVVGMQMSHLASFLDGLRRTSESMGPAAEQADELESGMAALHEEQEERNARRMVEGALVELARD